jgi:hypothetical protein
MSDETQTKFKIPLSDVSKKGAGFRVNNKSDIDGNPELQRQHVDQYKSSDIDYQADLYAIVHGTVTPTGDRGVLIVIDFHFTSTPKGKRFRDVKLCVAFGRGDEAIGSANDPVVRQIAPHGTFAMDASTQKREETWEGHASADAPASLAKLGIGGSYSRKTTTDDKFYSILNGKPWIQVRNDGDWNSADWHITENRKLKHGVPPSLRAAIIISMPEEGKFRAELGMVAKIGGWFNFLKVKRTVGANTGLQPVYFDTTEGKRKDFGPHLEDVDKSNLLECKLQTIGGAKVSRTAKLDWREC